MSKGKNYVMHIMSKRCTSKSEHAGLYGVMFYIYKIFYNLFNCKIVNLIQGIILYSKYQISVLHVRKINYASGQG